MWNYRESPLVDGDKLICTPGGARRDSCRSRQDDRRDDLEAPAACQRRPAVATEARNPAVEPVVPADGRRGFGSWAWIRSGLCLGHRDRL